MCLDLFGNFNRFGCHMLELVTNRVLIDVLFVLIKA